MRTRIFESYRAGLLITIALSVTSHLEKKTIKRINGVKKGIEASCSVLQMVHRSTVFRRRQKLLQVLRVNERNDQQVTR